MVRGAHEVVDTICVELTAYQVRKDRGINVVPDDSNQALWVDTVRLKYVANFAAVFRYPSDNRAGPV